MKNLISIARLSIYAIIASFILTSCHSKKVVTTTAYSVQPTESIGFNANGTRIVSVSETGRNKDEAVNNAMRKAAWELTFYGVHGDTPNNSAYPIISSPTARETHRNYFDRFFGNGGKFSKCVKINDKKSIQEFPGDGRVMVIVPVEVDVAKLRKMFIDDNIIER